MTKHKINNIRVGEILLRDFLIPRNISIAQLAKGTGISSEDIRKIIQGEMSLDAATAGALGNFFRNSAEFWMSEHAVDQDLENRM